MTPHARLKLALEGLAGDRVFPLVADEGTATPYIVYQIIPGDAQEFLSGEKPEKKQRRVQVNVWSRSSIEASEIAEQVEDALRAAPLQTEVLTIASDTYDETTKYRGTMQEFYVFC